MFFHIYINALLIQSTTQSPLILEMFENDPIYVILLETLFQISTYFKNIYIVIPYSIKTFLEQEICRWFPSYKDRIYYLYEQEDTSTFLNVVHQHRQQEKKSHCLLFTIEFPLISINILLPFIYCMQNENVSIGTCISKMNMKEEYRSIKNHTTLTLINECPYNIEDLSIIDLIWLDSEVSIDINQLFETKSDKIYAYFIPTYIANQECMTIRTPESLRYTKRVYKQEQNTLIVYKCLELFKKCESLEERLLLIEKKIS